MSEAAGVVQIVLSPRMLQPPWYQAEGHLMTEAQRNGHRKYVLGLIGN